MRAATSRACRVTGYALVLALASCSRSERVGQRLSLLTAYCQATVVGIGEVDVETDYLPNVVNCENGNASFEALKAQAVAARSYLYYRLDRGGSIMDSTGDQVYSCGRSPSMLAFMAVEATSGQILTYRDTQVAAFYVAGAKQEPPACLGGTSDPTSTEPYVTYNQGKSGDDIEQTSLGWVDPGNHANRGCMSQNGSDCLSDDGWIYDDILRFYYGEDIVITQAEGACVTPVPGPDGAGSNAKPAKGLGACTAFHPASWLFAVPVLWLVGAGRGRRRRPKRRPRKRKRRR